MVAMKGKPREGTRERANLPAIVLQIFVEERKKTLVSTKAVEGETETGGWARELGRDSNAGANEPMRREHAGGALLRRDADGELWKRDARGEPWKRVESGERRIFEDMLLSHHGLPDDIREDILEKRGVIRAEETKDELSGREATGRANIERTVAEQQFPQELLHALGRGLPSEQWQVIELVALQGKSYQEAAQILHIPVGSVLSRLSRGREMLSKLLLSREVVPETSIEGRKTLGESYTKGYVSERPSPELAVRPQAPMGETEDISDDELIALVLKVPNGKRGAVRDFLMGAARETTARATAQQRPEPATTVEGGAQQAGAQPSATEKASRGEVAGGSPATERPEWKDYKGKMELPDFVAWAYAPEREAGILTRAAFYGDEKLYSDYYNWRRRPNLPSEQHWLRDLPTGKALREQQDADRGVDRYKGKSIDDFDPQGQEAIRAYNKLNRRAQRRARLSSTTRLQGPSAT
jgi:RNA polymerase sigma factor (sigma-70 family)